MISLLNIDFWNYQFLAPNYLWLLLFVPVYFIYKILFSNKESGTFKLSLDFVQIKKLDNNKPLLFQYLIQLTFLIGVSYLIFALAKPTLGETDKEEDFSEGIDIVLAMDISGSMLATDFLPNRLEAAKSVAKDFIDGRKEDRIGLVAYEGEAYTACPATRNHEFLKSCVDDLQSGWLNTGTAIGTGLGTAVARLRSDSLKSKVIILLTDGESNRGEISPLEAAELAKNKNIRVYTIGVGSDQLMGNGINSIFGNNPLISSIDEKTLKKISKITNGEYFRAKDKNSLIEIYDKIERMETRRLIENTYHNEPPLEPQGFILIGLLLILSSWLINKILFEKIG